MARGARLKLFALCSDWKDISTKLSILNLEPKICDLLSNNCSDNFAITHCCTLSSPLTGPKFILESLKQSYHSSLVVKTTRTLSQATMTIQ